MSVVNTEQTQTPPSARIGSTVSLRGLHKSYGDTMVVRDQSMEIAAGEFITLLGPSGSGKTTTLMMLAGFVEPDAGEILVGGRDVSRVPARRRGLGFVFQQYLLFPHMTVGQNVAFPLELRGMKREEIRRAVADILTLVGLTGFEDRRPRELSGGQQQRVALARAMVYRPPVLLMDEPLGALDKKLRDQLQTEIKQLQRQLGLTVVYVTHDQEEALVLSDRIGVMRDGRLEQFAAPRELYERPATRFVADFLGAANFLSGRVEDGHVGLDCGARMATRRHDLSPGAPAVVAVQPGRVRLVGPDEGFAAGIVSDVTYVGSMTRVVVILTDGSTVRVDPPGGPTPARGDRVAVACRPDDVSVFPAGG
jgi:ABC-type Fe3+/spermidine/putrescine transport system ATPase subunit